MPYQIVFFILSILAISTALMVVVSRNPVHSVLYLIVTFSSIAGHYFLLNSQFLGAVHIIVYMGAIMVLFLYVIMMLNLNRDTEPNKSNFIKAAAVLSGCLLMIVLVVALKGVETMQLKGSIDPQMGLITNLGTVLYKEYWLPFELSGILFLAGMVGAVMIGKKEAA
jgi:NADH-quinone oxidoreductase subunit J